MRSLILVSLIAIGAPSINPFLAAEPPKQPEKLPPGTRTKRLERWKLKFNYDNTKGLLEQLQACDAFVLLPDPDKKLFVLRNLGARPANPLVEDVKKLNRLAFIVAEGAEVGQFVKELQLSFTPKAIIAL